MQIAVKTIRGKIINLEVEASDTIDSVKAKIQDKIWDNKTIPIDELNFIYVGKPLTNGGKSMSDCNIQNGAIIHVNQCSNFNYQPMYHADEQWFD
jgi:hypothetical protein